MLQLSIIFYICLEYIYNEFGRDTILKVEKFQIFISKFKDFR